MNKPTGNTVIRALDFAVAFATLETYGVVDARTIDDKQLERAREARRRLQGRRPTHSAARGVPTGTSSSTRTARRRHTGRPHAATAAGRRRHREALRRVDHLGIKKGRPGATL